MPESDGVVTTQSKKYKNERRIYIIRMWSHRESNPNLIFRRDLFYPLNYETPCRCCGL